MPIGTSFPVFLLKKIQIYKRHKRTRYTRENSWRLFCWMEDWNLRTMWRSEPLSRLLWQEGISYSATPPKAQMPAPCASAWLKQLNATGLIHLDTFCSFCRSFPNSETNQLVSNSCRYCLGLLLSLNIAICLDFLSISVSRCSYFLPSRGIIDRLHFYAYIIVMKGEIWYMNTYGYVRVSSREQNENRQLIALKEVGLTGNHLRQKEQAQCKVRSND